MKIIKLTQDKVAIVDDGDFNYLSQWKWCINSAGYAIRAVYLGGGRANRKTETILMHRLINNTPEGAETDHINRNPLDNRRANLRTVSRSENSMNKPIQANNTSGIKGVSWNEWSKKWEAYICVNRKKIYLGVFSSLDVAAKVRLSAEQKYHIGGTEYAL